MAQCALSSRRGGRKVSIRRPRVRSGRQEVPLPTFQAMAQTDPLRRRTVEQLLVGVSTRGYARSLEPLPADIPSRSVSKSAVSRRFVAKTASQLAAWQTTPLDELDLVGLLLDGVHIGEHYVVVALGIGVDGTKHALGLWEGSAENATVCQSLLANLQSRGLRTDRSILVMLDGSKALWAAVTAVFGRAALVQRCQIHKTRNILDHLPERQRLWVLATLRLPERGREDRDAIAPELGPPSRPGASRRGGQCARRARGDGDRAEDWPLAASPALAGHDQRRREPHQQDPPHQMQREALPGRPDDAALGRRRRPQSGQGVPAPEGTC